MPPINFVLSLLVIVALAPASLKALATPPTTTALQDCPTRCGNVSVPYPFGLRSGCYRQGFELECSRSASGLMLRLPGTQVAKNKLASVANVSLDEVIVQLGVTAYCGSGINTTVLSNGGIGMTLNPDAITMDFTELGGSPYTLSSTRNKFVVLGCYTIGGVFIGFQPAVVCASTCTKEQDIVNGTCSTLSGCCQSIIPKSLKDFHIIVVGMGSSGLDQTYKMAGRCNYAFLMEAEQYEFRSTDLYDDLNSKRSMSVPVVLDWSIEKYNCSVATTTMGYACGANALCVDSANGPGYRCRCSNGHTGNPYVADGCQDINECEDPMTNTCSHICKNTLGSFTCSCPVDTRGDGLKTGKGCISDVKRFPLLHIILGSSLGFLLLILSCGCLYWFSKKRKLIRLREKFFVQNGGLIMKNIMISQGTSTQSAKIFLEEELIKATDNYNEKNVIGQGGFGMVYIGTLPDKTLVAIKKSKIEDKKQVAQFINEIVILSQIKHRNVVKILGCCLDSQVPLLVYEYIPNGTLYYHLHDDDRFSSLSWPERLKIAVEIADAISYLHSFAVQPILHRDIKSMNILLDENYCAKVSDFGISKIIPPGKYDQSTIILGTKGYLDPESMRNGQLTTWSDVYSFGVILAELLTGQMPILRRNNYDVTLAYHFVTSMNENKFFEVLEPRIRNEGNPGQIQAVGNLTCQCLRPIGVQRPPMRDVAAELNKLLTTEVVSVLDQHPTSILRPSTSRSTEINSASTE